jgi:hypothetical protein
MVSLASFSRRTLVAAAALGSVTPDAAKNKNKKRRRKQCKKRCPHHENPSLNGTIVIRDVTGPACTSPVGVCLEMQFSGVLDGTAAFTAKSLVPTVDTPATGVVLFTADTTLSTSNGKLILKDAGALGTTGQENFVNLATLVGGDGQWAGATGQIRVAGTFPTAIQDGAASNTALLSTPEDSQPSCDKNAKQTGQKPATNRV